MVDFFIQVKKLCVRCGEDLSLYAKHCSRCGKKVMFKGLLETDLGKSYFDSRVSSQVKKILQFRTRLLENNKSIVETIKDKYLDEGEEIILKFPKERNVLCKCLGDIEVGAIFFAPILICIIVALFIMPFDTLVPDLLLVIFFGFLVSIAIPLYTLSRGIVNYRNIRKLVPMSVKELKAYPEFDLITNRRWISKSFDVLKGEISSYLPHGIERLGGDYLSANLRTVEIKTDHMGYLENFTIRALDISTGVTIHSSSSLSKISGPRNVLSKLEEKVSMKKELKIDGSYRITF